MTDHRFVSSFRDRHGKTRWRFRRKGMGAAYLPDAPGSARFEEAYQHCMNGFILRKKRRAPLTPLIEEVYFIGSAHGAIKIGTSINPAKRLCDLQTGYAARLRILATTPGGKSVEAAYHRRFAEHRLGGEWFVRHSDILAEIAIIKKAKRLTFEIS